MEFTTKRDLFKFMTDNREKLIAQRKAVKKDGDCPVIVSPILVTNKAMKAVPVKDSLKVVCVINTTNFLDSHNDLHLPGIWTKSLKENRMIMHLQEHNMEFDKIISDGEQLKAYTKIFTWSELGFPYNGSTEALIFESNVLKSRNEYMLNQYANGWVRNHSVGMYYVKLDMAVNDEEFPNEFDAWNKYYPHIANQDRADELGHFFYVQEAKVVEGSAVPIGSNTATPTLETREPLKGTQKHIEPDKSTHKIDYKFLITNLKT